MEATAEDESETQSQTHTDMYWDHSADVESDPLLGSQSGTYIEDTLPRPKSLLLPYDQAHALLNLLDSTRYILETFVEQAQERGGDEETAVRKTRSWRAFKCFPGRRRTIAKYIFVITAILQAVNLLIVSILDIWPRQDNQSLTTGTCITMIILQLASLFFVVMVSVRLVRQLYKRRVSIVLLAQSYMSTLLLFAGIYTLTYRMQPDSWKFIQEEIDQNPILVIVLYSKFLYFSVSTATLCGSDNVLPRYWYNCIFTALQMLMSFVYFASILGQTISQDTQYRMGLGSQKVCSPHRSELPSTPTQVACSPHRSGHPNTPTQVACSPHRSGHPNTPAQVARASGAYGSTDIEEAMGEAGMVGPGEEKVRAEREYYKELDVRKSKLGESAMMEPGERGKCPNYERVT